MTAQTTPTVFLSHSHSDKSVARALVRRLTAHGVKVWIDERELRLGETLTSSISSQIQASNTLLVIASHASAKSKWVGLELDFAREHRKSVIPFFIDPLAEHERFQTYLGVDATSPQAFADAVHGLMRDLFLSVDRELPTADPSLLTAGLRELARQEPDLAPLIDGYLDSQGLHQDNLNIALTSPFHPLDEALNGLFDLTPNNLTAMHAAYGFRSAGAGARALFSWIAATGDGEMPLNIAVGSDLDSALIPTAIKLLGACDPPNNHALYNFIHHNAGILDEGQRRSVIRLVTWPVRANTERLGDVLGWVAQKHFPDATEIQLMWSRWVRDGAFDGEPNSPRDLARYLADAHKEGLPGWEQVNETLRSHVRGHLRSGDKDRVGIAMNHVMAAADAGAPVLSALLRETNGVSATAEWNDWRTSDPDTAELMEWHVSELAKEAVGERNWLRAAKDVAKQRRRILAKGE